MRPMTKEETADRWWNLSLGPKRVCCDPFDFGDEATVGKCLKKHGTNCVNAKEDSYGIFLGGDKPAVLIRSVKDEIVGGEEFDTIEELKMVWVLD